MGLQHVAYCPSQMVWAKALATTDPDSREGDYSVNGGGTKVLGWEKSGQGDRKAGPGLGWGWGRKAVCRVATKDLS